MADQDRKPQGLGDLLARATSALRIRPCSGCDRRAAALNRWLNFSAATNPAQRSSPDVTAPFGASVRLSSLSTLVCDRARIVVCAAFEKIEKFICDATRTVTQFICDVFSTLTQVICDALTTVAQTICDVTETIMQTICDVSQSVCKTICDAFSWLPWPLDDLVCEASHLVCDTVCTLSHVVSTVVCTASHIVQTVVCAASHIVASLVCLFGHLVTEVVCWIGHIVRVALCILWAVILAFICILITVLQWLECLLRKLAQAIYRIRRKPPKIKHVFVLMLENRSFDHMLGFSGIPGIDGLSPNGRFNHDPANSVNVFASPQADFKLSKDDTDPPHEFDYVLTQLCYDAATDSTPSYDPATGYPPITNAGFVAAYEHTDPSAHKDPSQNPFKVMRCFAPGEEGNDRLPILTTLAREFAVCDRWFASLPGPTWPNRFFVHAASSGGLDDSPSGFETVTSTLVDGYTFENGTIFDALDRACLDWKVFHGDALPQVFAISGMTFNRLLGKFGDFDEFEEQVMDKGYSPVYTFIEPDYGNVLPVVSDGDFTCGNSQHPLDDVTRGEKLIKKVYEVIRASPHWENSVLIVTYDEHGGFYDHVRPPAAVPPGDALSDPDNDHHHFAFDQLGVRVPAVVVSPLIPRGTVDHRHVYDHSSVPATLERLFGLDPLTNRDAAANDILHLLTLPSARGDAPTALPNVPDSGFRCDDD